MNFRTQISLKSKVLSLWLWQVLISSSQTLVRQNDRHKSYVRPANTSIFGLFFVSVCLMKSICYSLIYSSLANLLKLLNQQKKLIYPPMCISLKDYRMVKIVIDRKWCVFTCRHYQLSTSGF